MRGFRSLSIVERGQWIAVQTCQYEKWCFLIVCFKVNLDTILRCGETGVRRQHMVVVKSYLIEVYGLVGER